MQLLRVGLPRIAVAEARGTVRETRRKRMVRRCQRNCEDRADWEDLVHSIVNWECVNSLLLAAVSCETSINPVTNTDSFLIATNIRDNPFFTTIFFFLSLNILSLFIYFSVSCISFFPRLITFSFFLILFHFFIIWLFISMFLLIIKPSLCLLLSSNLSFFVC